MAASAKEMDESTVVERLRARDPAAEAELFRRLRRSMWRRAFRVVGNRAVADEVVHDAWIRAITAIDSFQGRSRFSTWLISIVLNEARCHRRRESRSRPVSSFGPEERRRRNDESEDDGHAAWLDRVGNRNEQTPEVIFLEKEAAGRVEHALGLLSKTQRSVVVLRDFNGASSAEACDVLAITDVAQRVHLCRARATLRRVLEDEQRLCA